jgi:endonuclease YncB( thermonuclease family)
MAAIIDFGSFKGSIMRPRSSVKASVSDGDTVSAVTDEAFGVRFLGVDTPETKIPGPPFSSTSHPDVAAHFQQLLDTARLEASGFHPQLAADLRARYPDGAAGMGNHHAHAKAAEAELEAQMLADEQQMTDAGIEFQLFLAYAMEKMDVYGRLLAFLNRNQPNATNPGPRPPSYNQRMLTGGFARPYFIWPNIDPFRQHPDLLSAVPTPAGLPGWVANAPSLIDARAATAAARAAGAGTWQANRPLMLDAHEFRAMWDLRPPHRWVVDLSGQHYGAILAPHRYLDIPHHEDRLYLPPEFMSLWLERGWTQAA